LVRAWRAALTLPFVVAFASNMITMSRSRHVTRSRSGRGPCSSTRAPFASVVFPVLPFQPQQPPSPIESKVRPVLAAAAVIARVDFSASTSKTDTVVSARSTAAPGGK
jgi:hypothetical protein